MAHNSPVLLGLPSRCDPPTANSVLASCRRLHRPLRLWPVTQLHALPRIGLIWTHLCSLRGLRHRHTSGGRPCRRPLQRLSADGAGHGKRTSTALGVVVMSISLEKVAEKYLVARKLSDGTRKEYRSTVTKWLAWGQGGDVDQIERYHIRDFLDWVHDKATGGGGSNAGRTANKAARESSSDPVLGLGAGLRGPPPPPSTPPSPPPLLPPVFKSAGFHEPILWRHVSLRPESPNGQGRESRVWLALLPPCQDKEAVLPAHEPCGSGPSEEHSANRYSARTACV